MSLLPGEVFAGFVIERELGAGGMGVVYLARHPRLPRRVALKLLRTDLGADPSFVGRFRREAETVARLDHPNIVSIDDSGADNGQLWISMRFIDGTTASGALTDYPDGMPPARAVHIIEKVASALDFAHRHQVVHRDVKPANILLTDDGDGDEERVFLTDFGVAKAMGEIEAQATSLTAAGGVVATLDYAAPEQIDGKQLDGRCDVYALGCVLYKLLTGGIPYPGDTLGAKIYARMHRPPPAPSTLVPNLPPAFDGVIATALALEPADRYQTCKALAVAARAAIGSGRAESATTELVEPSSTDPTRMMGGFGPRVSGSAAGLSGPAATGSISPVTPHGPRRPTGSRPPSRVAGQGLGHTSVEHMPPDQAQFLGPGVRPSRPGRSSAFDPHRRTRRRSLLAVGAVLLAALIVVGVVLLHHAGIAGNASLLSQTIASSTPTVTTPSTQATRSATTTSPTTTSPTTIGGPLPVAGLPHSADLPDSTIVVSRDYHNKFGLYPVDVATGKIGSAIIPPTGNAQNPLISPDRGSVIYLQGDSTGNTIRTAAADGTGARLLFARPQGCVQIARPAWNPVDTQQLAISCAEKTGPRNIQLVDLKGNVSKTLPDSPGLYRSDDLSFSPDGRLVAFWGSTNAKAGDGRLYIQSTDGVGLPTPITPDGSHDADPDFSPDGSLVAFRRVVGTHAQIAIVATDGSGPASILTTTPSISQGPTWSPSGKQIAYKNDLPQGSAPAKDELWLLTVADPGDAHLLVVGDDGSVVASPAWGNR